MNSNRNGTDIEVRVQMCDPILFGREANKNAGRCDFIMGLDGVKSLIFRALRETGVVNVLRR